MSRLTDLIAKAKAKDSALGAELDREFKILSSRLPFGLNFERHSPEAVELPLRPIRKGDKVRVLPERGTTRKGDQRLWQVKAIHKAKKTADLELLGAAEIETQTVALDDLVVVAEFRDTIYPGLVSTGKVQRGGDKPCHTVINGENYHVLKALTYTHRGQVDAIYIDPPYNTGAKDWKYNNDYVEGDDLYRHSKWLAMMERRLLIAKELLNPADSVLIVTIDEKEYLRLGLLLEQIFSEARIQMISSVISQKGSARTGEFSRCNEFIYFVHFGRAVPVQQQTDMLHSRQTSAGDEVEWGRLTRNGANGRRTARPNLFYPIFFTADGKFNSVGTTLPLSADKSEVCPPEGTIAVFPTATDGTEMTWALSADRLAEYVKEGFVKFGSLRPTAPQPVRIYYLTDGYVQAAREGRIVRAPGPGVRWLHEHSKGMKPLTVWNMASHNAAEGGTNLLKKLLPDRRFPFPKSLYAVEDALRFFISHKPNAVVLDFFSGSGTTGHAVMRLNRQDGGSRQCISVTNNEVGAEEQRTLRAQNLRAGDEAWEKFGICDYITKPRVRAAITGTTPDGSPVKGDYKFNDVFPIADGFEENAEFFTLTYETPVSVNYNLAFNRIAPLLWLRAGARGSRIDKLPGDGWAVADAYGLLSNVDAVTPFIKALAKAAEIRIAYIVTDDDRRFQAIAKRLPDGVEPVRLYESYLTNFSFTNGE
ncbi:site-specific DNA-methyltransferase [Bordetella petrii]|uniref:site-specific DNA-methyltransferase n=1 Tax=Bordetella petrii TaxID=94624 RepID=UPI001E408EFE|nr:DNA methyltransferase [Bordetella petrii]MCD0502130.1 site-specific DNA-methyltransferase [Bordetella petrii]